MLGPEGAQLSLAGSDLLVEAVDQCQAGGKARGPRLGQGKPGEFPPATGSEQVAVGIGQSVLEEDRVDAVFQRAAVLDQVEAKAGPLPLGAQPGVGEPDLGDEAEPGQFGQDPGIDRVRLAGERRDPPRLQGIGDPHVPTGALELVVDEARTADRLDHGDHPLHRPVEAAAWRADRGRGERHRSPPVLPRGRAPASRGACG